MCDKQRCLDLHAIKLITDGPRLPDNKRDQIPNPYNWNVHKNTPYFVPPNYHYPYFDNTWFWKMKDLQNFFNPQWMNFQFGKGGSKGDSSNFVIEQRGRGAEGRGQVEKPEDKKFSILWIDENNEGNQHFAKKFHLSNEVSVQFFKTYADGTDYLKENQEKIRSSPSKYLLICRGYYKSEDKNPLNLLSFLDYCGLRTVPILVFTQDKSGLVTHLEAQAPSMRAFDWKERLNIVNNAEDFISKVKRLTQAWLFSFPLKNKNEVSDALPIVSYSSIDWTNRTHSCGYRSFVRIWLWSTCLSLNLNRGDGNKTCDRRKRRCLGKENENERKISVGNVREKSPRSGEQFSRRERIQRICSTFIVAGRTEGTDGESSSIVQVQYGRCSGLDHRRETQIKRGETNRGWRGRSVFDECLEYHSLSFLHHSAGVFLDDQWFESSRNDSEEVHFHPEFPSDDLFHALQSQHC